jgi:two-component system phosphate regulon response regulator PhoB
MHKKKIFIVEDDKSISEIIQIVLQEKNYALYYPSDTLHIKSEIIKLMPDLILMDIGIQGMRGDILAKELKTTPKTKKIPIIILSANDSIAQIAKESFANGFIPKPFDINHLLETIKKHI